MLPNDFVSRLPYKGLKKASQKIDRLVKYYNPKISGESYILNQSSCRGIAHHPKGIFLR